ncbi:DUF6193 family natural product biosynthesis protein [Streptomyces griseosporeus]|uniref:DUF6193 family natural product biosynthesis protein n=1 Tax=Streptomyces griseosporeus TaxID=1910 RepID=UPI00370366B0
MIWFAGPGVSKVWKPDRQDGARGCGRRNTQFPWSNDLPYIVGDAQSCIVYAPLRVGGMLGESLTPREAAALVVVHLPDDCGPAFEGPWPRPDHPVG